MRPAQKPRRELVARTRVACVNACHHTSCRIPQFAPHRWPRPCRRPVRARPRARCVAGGVRQPDPVREPAARHTGVRVGGRWGRRPHDPGLRDVDERQPGRHGPFKIKSADARLPHRHPAARLLRGRRRADGRRRTSRRRTPRPSPRARRPPSTGLIDCGNWAVSASWTVPSDRGLRASTSPTWSATTPAAQSQIVFVVRDDASHSDLVVQTSDETWQAYNTYGGNSLYTLHDDLPAGQPGGLQGRVQGLLQPAVPHRGDDSGRSSLF